MASPDKHYHPLVASRLRTLLAARDWAAFPVYLATLSNSRFRTAGYLLGEQLMPELGEDEFWALAQVLVAYQPKAFLVTLLKSASLRGLDVRNKAFAAFCHSLQGNELDVQKTLLHLLLLAHTPEDMEALFRLLAVDDRERRIPYLIRTATLPAFYLLFHTLKYVEHDRPLLIRTVYFLMKRGDDASFNLASLLKAYFGLDEVHGTFSLRIEPYQLARLEGSFEAFATALNS